MRRWLLSCLAALLLTVTIGATDLVVEQRRAIGIDGLQEGLTGETATLVEDLSPVESTDLSHGLSSICQKLLPQLDTVILGGVRTAMSAFTRATSFQLPHSAQATGPGPILRPASALP